MTPKQYFSEHDTEHLEEVARKAGTSFGNFRKIALYGGHVGKNLASRLSEASDGKMEIMEILFPHDAAA